MKTERDWERDRERERYRERERERILDLEKHDRHRRENEIKPST